MNNLIPSLVLIGASIVSYMMTGSFWLGFAIGVVIAAIVVIVIHHKIPGVTDE